MDLPQRAVVATYDPTDGIGTLTLADGSSVRFGRSACRGDFSPAAGLPVQVTQIAPHPRGGLRATAIEPTAETVAQSDAARDSTTKSAAQAAGEARSFGMITVLLGEPFDGSRAALRALLAPIAHELGGALSLDDDFTIRVAGHDLRFCCGAAEYPSAALDERFWPAGAPRGQGFLCLLDGLPGFMRDAALQMGGDAVHAHHLAAVTWRLRIAHALLVRGAVGVVVHRAGHVLWTRDAWLARLGEPDAWSVGALVDLGTRQDGVVYSLGLDALAQRDVHVLPDPSLSADDAYDRSYAACHYACALLRAQATLPAELAVPIGFELGNGAPERANPDLALAPHDVFVVDARSGQFVLRPKARLVPLAEIWAGTAERGAAYLPYRLLLRTTLQRAGWTEVDRRTPNQRAAPTHQMFVFERQDRVRLAVTCGFGRLPQPGGHPDRDDAHIEFLVTLAPGAEPPLAALAMFGEMLHGRGPAAPPLGPQHRVQIAPITDAYPFVVLGWAGKIDLGAGAGVSLFGLLPMSAAERERVPSGACGDWAVQTGAPLAPARWAELG